MAKMSFLEVVCAALFMSVILWQGTSSSSLGPFSSTVTEETTATKGRDSSCDGITCPPGKHCKPNSEGEPECFCNKICTLEYDPVCGSDGKTYGNRCALNVTACKTNTSITVVHDGECKTGSDVCTNFTCPPGKRCVVNTTENLPKCVCDKACSFIHDPVCGSDGQTYDNDCLLRVEACKTNTNITVEHEGSCNNSCTGFKCPYYGRCVVDSDNRPTCVCPLYCTKMYSPVCGSDNKTYENKCLLKAEACKNEENITVVHKGKCMDGGCDKICTKEYDPVCGSDGKTYGNKCMFKEAACKSNSTITKAHRGECETVSGATVTASSTDSIPPDDRTMKP